MGMIRNVDIFELGPWVPVVESSRRCWEGSRGGVDGELWITER